MEEPDVAASIAHRIEERVGQRRDPRDEIVGDDGSSGGQAHVLDGRAEFRRDLRSAAAILFRPHVDEGGEHVTITRMIAVQRADGVEGRCTRGDLVVDEDERRGVGEQCAGGRLEQVEGRVRVPLLESGEHLRSGNLASRRVQVACGVEGVGHAVTETRCGFGESHDDSVGCCIAEEIGDEPAEPVTGTAHRGRLGGDVLTENRGDEQVRASWIASQPRSDEFGNGVTARRLHMFESESELCGGPRNIENIGHRSTSAVSRSTKVIPYG